ncbi:MAG: hypothetical protein R3E87_23615 [Burkholderiaceae bacterium]
MTAPDIASFQTHVVNAFSDEVIAHLGGGLLRNRWFIAGGLQEIEIAVHGSAVTPNRCPEDQRAVFNAGSAAARAVISIRFPTLPINGADNGQ